MRNRLLTCKTYTALGVKYAVVAGEIAIPNDGAELRCPKCGKHKRAKYQGEVMQYGMFELITLDFWHCAACGHDFAARWVRKMEVNDAN